MLTVLFASMALFQGLYNEKPHLTPTHRVCVKGEATPARNQAVDKAVEYLMDTKLKDSGFPLRLVVSFAHKEVVKFICGESEPSCRFGDVVIVKRASRGQTCKYVLYTFIYPIEYDHAEKFCSDWDLDLLLKENLERNFDKL